jgi:hypothetical protein
MIDGSELGEIDGGIFMVKEAKHVSKTKKVHHGLCFELMELVAEMRLGKQTGWELEVIS